MMPPFFKEPVRLLRKVSGKSNKSELIGARRLDQARRCQYLKLPAATPVSTAAQGAQFLL